jgi:hypothetical protein
MPRVAQAELWKKRVSRRHPDGAEVQAEEGPPVQAPMNMSKIDTEP